MSEPEEPRDEPLAWLAQCGFALAAHSAREPLPGDLSPRRYARLALGDGTSAILATYPADGLAACARFLATGDLLAQAGVRVPRVLAADCAKGFMLLEDLGPLTLADWAVATHRPWSELILYFEDALAQARRIAAIDPARLSGPASLSPPLDRALLEKELRQTWEHFLVPHGLTGEAADRAALTALLGEVCAALAADPAVPCHRDYMARNLMPLRGLDPIGLLRAQSAASRPSADSKGPSTLPGGGTGDRIGVAVLDHQDLRLGPPAYDLASLLNDTLFPTPEAEEALLAKAAPSPAERLRYHRAAAQRTLKAIGTYAVFAERGVPRHLPLIPRTLGRSLGHLRQLPEAANFASRLAHLWQTGIG